MKTKVKLYIRCKNGGNKNTKEITVNRLPHETDGYIKEKAALFFCNEYISRNIPIGEPYRNLTTAKKIAGLSIKAEIL